MFLGIGFLAVLTATVASRFVKGDRADETTEILEALRRLEGRPSRAQEPSADNGLITCRSRRVRCVR